MIPHLLSPSPCRDFPGDFTSSPHRRHARLYPASSRRNSPPPDPAHLSSWLVDAAALGAILLVFLKVIDHFKRKPSLEQELEKLLRQIRSELNQLRHEQTVASCPRSAAASRARTSASISSPTT